LSVPGKIEKFLLEKIKQEHTIHLALIDPEEVTQEEASAIVSELVNMGSAGVMVGGSTLASTSQLDEVLSSLRGKTDLPVILFPNSVTAISRYADAIFFMSLLNSNNPMFITGFQAMGAPMVRRYNLEAIPLGYVIVGEGSTAAYVGQAHAIPLKKPEVAVLYALAAQYMGMRFVYLEAGSGAEQPVPPEMIRLVASTVSIPVIVGGGIKTPEQAAMAADAGASIIVTGTVGEEDRSGRSMRSIIERIRASRS
jgi:phosphoglycerol geranylgeranyltransferase